MKKVFYLICLSCFLFANVQAQPGCTDAQANNYDENAITNDGSCIYPPTDLSLVNIVNLSSDLNEVSGLAKTSLGLWTHNDFNPGGDEDKLYQIDSVTGVIQKTVIVATADNTDWEDLAESDTHVYIGDFGNNVGSRMDLKIYRVSKADMDASTIVNAEVIEFSYSDQTDFTPNQNNNNFDCEAFFYYNDSLYLFSKNWVDNQTRYYSMSANPGTHTAQYRGTLDVNGLITGADRSEDGVVSLLGYTEVGFTFLWLLFDYEGTQLLSGNKRLISLGSGLNNSQTEGIVFSQNGSGFIVSENFSVLPPKLLSFSTSQWTDHILVGTEDLYQEEIQIKVFPNPFDRYINVEFGELLNGTFNLQLVNSLGQLVYQSSQDLQQENLIRIDTHSLGLMNGWYVLQLTQGNKVWNIRLLK